MLRRNLKHARFCLAGLLVCLGLQFVICVKTDAALILFKPQVTVSGAIIRLGDVAEIRDADPQMTARLKELTLSPAPAAGHAIRLDFEAVRGRLIAQGVNLTELEFSGNSITTVTSAATATPSIDPSPKPQMQLAEVPPVTQKRISGQVAKSIGQYIGRQSRELKGVAVDVKFTAEQMQWIATGANPRFEISGGAAPWTGEQTFTFRFIDRQGKPQDLQLNCTVSQLPRVLVPRLAISRGQVLREDDVVFRDIDVVPDQGEPVTQMSELVGREVVRSMRAGEVITTKDVREIPLVRKGDLVTLVSKTRGVTVRMEAKAQSEGAFGSQVELLTLDGRRKLLGRVTGYHEAEIRATPATGPATNSGENLGIKFISAEKDK